jgi:hypothetical protein
MSGRIRQATEGAWKALVRFELGQAAMRVCDDFFSLFAGPLFSIELHVDNNVACSDAEWANP